MKNKLLPIVSLFASCIISATAATMSVNNLVGGPGDILYANKDNVLMSGGVVTMGYFAAGVTPTTIAELQAALSTAKYTLVTSATPGDMTAIFGQDVAGYASQLVATTVPGGLVTGPPLLGRPIYSIVADNANLNLATQYALVQVGSFASDDPVEQGYFSNPKGGTVIIGQLSSILLNPDPALPTGNGTYGTLKMAPIPEPSAALLGALGALGLLRRRRN